MKQTIFSLVPLLSSLVLAVGCRGESPDYTHLTYHTSESIGDTCDGPCPPIEVTTCSISVGAEETLLVQMLADKPSDQFDDRCDPAPPVYNGGYYVGEVHLVDPLRGNSAEGQEFPVIFMLRQFLTFDWEQGDFLVLSTRTDAGERFATAAIHVTPTTQRVETSTSTSGGVHYKLPSDISALKSELADVSADFAAECPTLADQRLADDDFKRKVRTGEPCTDGADIADEFDDDPNDATD